MNPLLTATYCHPLVPPEWIAAHGVRPQWLRLRRSSGSQEAMRRGVCPYAAAWIEAAAGRMPFEPSPSPARPKVLAIATTTCDQMRYAAAAASQVESGPDRAVFLMNIPRTWQTAAARQMYRDELRRLGRFLQKHGAAPPEPARLAAVMRKYDEARRAWGTRPAGVSARQYAAALAALRGPGHEHPLSAQKAPAIGPSTPAGPGLAPPLPAEPPGGKGDAGGMPVAVVGGPLLEDDLCLLDLIEQAGARIVVDGTEGGQRTLPRPLDFRTLDRDPFEELARAYFDEYPDVMRRPNHTLYEWLARQIAERGVQGLIVYRYVWCDLWHAEVARLEARCGVPVLDLDAAGDDRGAWARILTRVEAFLESLLGRRSAVASAPAYPATTP